MPATSIAEVEQLALAILSPVLSTALPGPDGFVTVSARFHRFKVCAQAASNQYKIDPHVRMHHAPLSRAVILPAVGQVVKQIIAAAPPIAGTSRQIRADMTNPQYVVLVEVLKNVCGVAIVRGDLYEGAGRKFNLEAIAESLHGVKAKPAVNDQTMDVDDNA